MELPNNLIAEVIALGYCPNIIFHTCGEVILLMLAAGVLGSAHPLGDCDSLKAALKQSNFMEMKFLL